MHPSVTFKRSDTTEVPVVRSVGAQRPANDSERTRAFAPGEKVSLALATPANAHPATVHAIVVSDGERIRVRADHPVFANRETLVSDGEEIDVDRACVSWVHGLEQGSSA